MAEIMRENAREPILKEPREIVSAPDIERLPCIDLFFHDSAHVFEIMRFEYETAGPVLAQDWTFLAWWI